MTPDMATVGKIVGGGFPLAAVTGRDEIMAVYDSSRAEPDEFVSQVGTLNGNHVAAAAGLATLAELRKPGAYERLHGTGRRLREALETLCSEAEIPALTTGEDPTFDILFMDQPVSDYRSTLANDRGITEQFNVGLLNRGVLKGCRASSISRWRIQTRTWTGRLRRSGSRLVRYGGKVEVAGLKPHVAPRVHVVELGGRRLADPLTAEQLFDFPSEHTDDGCYELVEGKLYKMAPPGPRHGEVTLNIGAILRDYVRSYGLGRVMVGDPGFILGRNPDTVRGSDVAYVSNQRHPADQIVPVRFFELAPDLGVEVVSPFKYTLWRSGEGRGMAFCWSSRSMDCRPTHQSGGRPLP